MKLALHAGQYPTSHLQILQHVWSEMLDRWRIDRAAKNLIVPGGPWGDNLRFRQHLGHNLRIQGLSHAKVS